MMLKLKLTKLVWISTYLRFILGVYFPQRPIVRKVKQVKLGNQSHTACSKVYQSNSKLGNGLLFFWCGEHRTCLGWVLLRSAESLEIVYSTLLSRFSVLPRIICYDNGCNLSEYCYNRAPKYGLLVTSQFFCRHFANTIFVVDAFHFKGHINCSHGYNSSSLMAFKGKSSVVHEQQNSKLAKLKISSMFMRFDNYVTLIRTITTLINFKERQKFQ